jgi:hypothetical protein
MFLFIYKQIKIILNILRYRTVVCVKIGLYLYFPFSVDKGRLLGLGSDRGNRDDERSFGGRQRPHGGRQRRPGGRIPRPERHLHPQQARRSACCVNKITHELRPLLIKRGQIPLLTT